MCVDILVVQYKLCLPLANVYNTMQVHRVYWVRELIGRHVMRDL